MNGMLASASDILSTPWGMTVFILLDIAILLVVIVLNYRWLFKRLLDILFSFVFLVVFLPFFLIFLAADAIYNKVQNAYKTLFTGEYYCGKRGKLIYLVTFSTERILHDAEGNLLPEAQRITKMGKILRGCGMKYYPLLAAVFTGKLSFVGPRPLSPADFAAMQEEDLVRYQVRPGLVSSLESYGGDSLTYDDLLEEDAEYVRKRGLFRDIGFFISKIVHRLRGETVRRYGECTEKSYVQWLLEQGRIDEEEAKEFAETQRFRIENYKKQVRDRNVSANRSMLR